MGILDDLKNQTEAQKTGEQNEEQRKAELAKYYQDNIHPKMFQLYNFLKELVEHLNYLNKDTKASYPILPGGMSQDFNQSEYKVTIDSAHKIKNINLRFFCNLEEPLNFDIEHEDVISRYTEVLDGYRIPYERKDKKDNDFKLIKSDFEISGPITAHIIFQGDVENSCINMLMINFEKPGTHKHLLKDQHITDEFIDGLGKYILRENPNFLKLDIGEEEKEKIRQKVQENIKRRQEELEEAERLIQEEEQRERLEKEKKSWKNLFKK